MSESIPYLGEALSLLTAVTWGLAVVLFRKSGETTHPIALNLFKDTLAVILFIPTIYIVGGNLFYEASANDYLLLIISGILGIGLADTLFLKSLNLLGASLTAIVDCAYAPMVLWLSFIWLGERLSVFQMIGVALIIFALFTSAGKKGRVQINRHDLTLGLFLGVFSLACMAVGIVMVKPILNRAPILWVTEWRLIGGVVSLVCFLAFYSKRRDVISTLFNSKGWAYTISSSFIGAYLAMMFWLAGMKFTQVSIAASLNQTSNIFIFMFGALLLKEPINRQRIVGIILGVAGSFLVTFA